MLLQETHLRSKDTHILKIKGWRKDISCKWKEKKSWSSNTYTQQNIDFKTKAIVRDKEGHYVIIKGTIKEDITLINT